MYKLKEIWIKASRCEVGGRNIFPAKPTSTHPYWKMRSTRFYSDFHVKWVDVKFAGKIILKSSLNAPNNCQTYHCRHCWCCHCILHCRRHSLNLSPVQAPSLVVLPLLYTVVSLLCLLILAIPLYSSTNNTSWINYYYLDNVNTTDALIVLMKIILVGFVFHTVDGVYVAMLLAWTLLKLEDGASNMATRSQLAAWMDAVIRALCMDFAKDTEPTIVAMSSIVQRAYSGTICANFIILWLTSPAQWLMSQSQCLLHWFHNRVRHSD